MGVGEVSHLTIGLVAYAVDPAMVMVRVPNERGRWMLVDRSVVEVGCPHCGAITGEPCRAVRSGWRSDGKLHDPIRYHVGVHVARKQAWSDATGLRFPARRAGPHKLRIRADELAALQGPPPDLPEPEPGLDIDVPVTPKAGGILDGSDRTTGGWIGQP